MFTAKASIGDLIRAARALGIDSSGWADIAPFFGLRLETLDESADLGSIADNRQPLKSATSEGVTEEVEQPAAGARARRRRPTPVPATLQTIARAGPPPPVWLTPSTERVAAPTAEHRRRPLPDPLLITRWVPGIIASLVATACASSELDALALVGQIARGGVLEYVPHLIRPTLGRGAQILVDVSPAMVPFAHDQAGLVRSAGDVLGNNAIDVVRFEACPLRGAGATPGSWRPYEFPSLPRPVLVLSDLGIRGARDVPDRATVDEWLEFAQLAAQSSCPLVALVPYPLRRVAAPLRRRFHVIPWDRATSVSTVRRVLGGPLEVP